MRHSTYTPFPLVLGWVWGCSDSSSNAASQGSSGGNSSGGTGGTSAGGKAAGGSAGTSSGGSPAVGACALTSDRIRITEIDVGATIVADEDEAALHPLVISPKPSGGARVAWMGDDSQVHVSELDESDQLTGASAALPAHDFSDLYADDTGGVLLLTRDAEGGGTLNCGEPSNLCGTPPDPPIPCFDMYFVRFDGTTPSWATKLTDSSASLPPYSTGPTGESVYMIWWYAHHGRIAFDGANYAGYFGSAISVSQSGCINIHQGDRMQIVDGSGALQSGGFEWGCSHSGYERIVWDDSAQKFVTVCKTDNNNRIAYAPGLDTIYPVDLAYSNLGNLVVASGGGYWLTASDIQDGQPANADGQADVHLLHFSSAEADQDITLASDPALNSRAPHLAAYGSERMVAAWETSTQTGDLRQNDNLRTLHVQVLSRATGGAEGEPLDVDVRGNRYQDFKEFPDGSVAYAARGSSDTTIKVLRILPCE